MIAWLITYLSCDTCIYIDILGRDVVLSTEISSPPFAAMLRCHCLPHPVADVPSAPGEQLSEAYVPLCPCTG